MSNEIRLLMLGAMYENGGNTTHRFLDGHPQLFVYPYESQLGSQHVKDLLTSTFPVKYRWPEFPLEATPYQDYKAIIDEEGKVRARTPHVSKFRHTPFEMNDDERCARYQAIIEQTGRSRGNNVAAFFQATFDAWKNYRRTGHEQVYVGYSPILVIDAEKIFTDLPNAHFLHVVRNPWSAYADTKKRPVPLSLANYMLGWTLNQFHALTLRRKYPDRLHIVRIEDVLAAPRQALSPLCAALGLDAAPTLDTVSWNGTALTEVYPWGTIRKASPEANLATAKELSDAEIAEIRWRSELYLDAFAYRDFL